MNRMFLTAVLGLALVAPAAAQAPSRAAPQPKANIDKMDDAIRSYQDATKYYQSGQFKLAEQELEKFLESVGQHAGGNFMMGLVQIELQDIEKARTSFRAAVNFDPEMVAPRGYLGAIEAFSGNQKGALEQKTALEKMKVDCGASCPKAAEIAQALQRVEENMAAAQQQPG